MHGCVNVRARANAHRCIGVRRAMRYRDREGAWGRGERVEEQRRQQQREEEVRRWVRGEREDRERGRVDGDVVREA